MNNVIISDRISDTRFRGDIVTELNVLCVTRLLNDLSIEQLCKSKKLKTFDTFDTEFCIMHLLICRYIHKTLRRAN